MAKKKDAPTRVLVIAAHPDDPEYGCAGTVARWAAQGKEITYLLLTSGDKGSKDPAMRPGRLASLREKEQREAARKLGVQESTLAGRSMTSRPGAVAGEPSQGRLGETERAELLRLCRENSDLRLDRAFLKKASFFVAQEASDTNGRRSR